MLDHILLDRGHQETLMCHKRTERTIVVPLRGSLDGSLLIRKCGVLIGYRRIPRCKTPEMKIPGLLRQHSKDKRSLEMILIPRDPLNCFYLQLCLPYLT